MVSSKLLTMAILLWRHLRSYLAAHKHLLPERERDLVRVGVRVMVRVRV